MIRWRVLREVTRLTFREFMRTPSAVFWTYGFPLLMTVVIGLAFRSDPPPLPVAVVESEFSEAQFDALLANARLEPKLLDRAAAEEQFQHGTVLLIISGDPEHTRIKLDRKRPDAELARLQVEHTLQERRTFEILQETTPGRRYIDWLIPGLIGLNLLGAGLWGVGYNLVQMRVKNILRRLMVTPMYRSEFMIAFLLSRLTLVLPEAALILGFSKLMFGVPIAGSLWTILLIVLLGGLSFTGLGLLIASRPRTVETVSGFMNLTMFPMWMLGGVFFDAARYPDAVQPLVKILPITHFTNALRAVTIDGAGVVAIAGELAFLAGFGLLTLAMAIRFFRWT